MPPEDDQYPSTAEAGIITTMGEDSSKDDAATLSLEDAAKFRESMLDVFPFSEEELDTVLEYYPAFEPKATLTFSALMQRSCKDDSHLQRIRYVETTFLPEAALLLEQAYQDAFVIGSGHDEAPQFKYLEAISILIGRRGARGLFRVLFHAASHTEKNSNGRKAEALADLIYRLILAAHHIQTATPRKARPTPLAWITSLVEKASGPDGHLTETEWTDWTNSIAPQVYQTLSTFAHLVIFNPKHRFRITNPPLSFPETDQECAFWSQNFQSIPSSIALVSPRLGGKWIRQYSSDYDGFSFAALQEALLGYQGPTTILIQTTAGDAFGFYSDQPWKESRNWFGEESDSFLFGLQPSLQYFGRIGASKPYNMRLYNPVTHHFGDLYGLCVGGVADKSPRLHITPTLEHCKAQSMDGVFEMGTLLSNHELYFDVDVVEVWAANTSEEDYAKSLKAGRAQNDYREGARLQAARVDRRQFLEDFQEGLFGTTLFEHRRQSRGRHSFVADDEEGKGYFVEHNPPTPNQSGKSINKAS